MNIDVQWFDDSKLIVHTVYEGMWNFDDYLNASAKMAELMDGVDHKVDFIFEFRQLSIPGDMIGQFTRMQTSPHATHRNYGFSVLVGMPGILDTLLRVYSRVFMNRRKFARAGSVDEAVKIIREQKAAQPAAGSQSAP